MQPLRLFWPIPAMLILAMTAAAGQHGPIYDLPGYRTVDGARSMAVADLDGDGLPDAVVAGPGELVTMLAVEGGQFLRRASAPIGVGPRDVTLHDIDGDGLLDALVCDGAADIVQILRGHGSGVFTPLHNVPTGRTPVSAMVGDLDGDDRPDLAVVNFDHYFVGYSRGLDGGGFAPAERLRVGFQPSRGWMVDVDGDGDLDIVTLNQGEATVSVLVNDGAGSFEETVTPVEGAPVGMDVGDLDGDGLVELVVGYERETLVYENRGGASFQAGQRLGSYRLRDVFLGDYDGDGDLDASLYLSVSVGGMQIEVHENSDGLLSPEPVTTLIPGGEPRDLAWEDINGDGQTDALLATASLLRAILREGGSLRMGDGVYPNRAFQIEAADLTGDGAIDIAVAEFPELAVLQGAGGGRFQPAHLDERWGDNVALIRLRSGALPSLVGTTYEDDRLLLVRNDSGSLGPIERMRSACRPGQVRVLDLDEDGFEDIVVAGGCTYGTGWTGQIAVHFGRGDGTLELVIYDLSLPAISVAVGDVTGDGIADLVVASRQVPPPDPRLIIRPGLGGRQFGPEMMYPGLEDTVSIELLDVSPEPGLDLLVRDPSNFIAVQRNDGEGRFGPPEFLSLPDRPGAATVDDFDGDGRDDLLVTLLREDVVLLRQSEEGSFRVAASFAATHRAGGQVKLADVDDDGLRDLLVPTDSDTGIGGLVLFLNRGGALPPCLADVDRDGDLTFFDFLQFQTSFAAGDLAADIDADGALTFFDFLEFQTLFSAGCAW